MYDNNNSGALFKNDNKTTSNQPDYNGSVQVDDKHYWIAAWIKQGKKGKFMSLAFTPKTDKAQATNHTPTGDEIPF